ncbi:MAG: glycosyl transferase family 2 [Pedobacter sp.]|jgi:glycosyltransferase involved in cell wall biosynthesis|nr:glycosyl transferase family 2 [Pedobacter sp.]
MIIFTYFVLFFLVIRFSVTVFNFLSNPKLPAFAPTHSDLTSIVITVRNEESNLLNLLHSIIAQEYRNIEVIIYHSALDSNDVKLVEAVCKKDPRFRLMKGPAGDYSWVTSEISGDYLLFLDSNTSIEKRFINSLVNRLKVFKIAAMSIMPNKLFESFLQRLVLPLNDFVLLNLIPLRLIKLLKSPSFLQVDNYNCLIVDATLYRNKGWQAKIDASKGAIDLIKIVKQDNFKAELLLANKLVYQVSKLSKSELLKSVAESLKLNFGSVVIQFVYLLLVVAGPLIIFLGIDLEIIILPIGLIFLSRIMISFMTDQNPVLNVLLHPLQMIMLVVVFIIGIQSQLLTAIKHNKS